MVQNKYVRAREVWKGNQKFDVSGDLFLTDYLMLIIYLL